MTASSSQYPAGTYVKGDDARVAYSSADAVALVFRGFALAKSETKVEADAVVAPVTPDVDLDGPDYRALQELAKEVGIPANQSKPALEAALEEHANKPSTPLTDPVTDEN